MGARGLVAIGCAAAAYLGLVVLLTWPLAAEAAGHVPQPRGFLGDLYYAGWALAWQTHALATDPARFAHANVYGGAPLALFYGTPGFALLPAFAPVFLATGNPTLALNVALLSTLALTATVLHLVVRSWTGSHLAGLAAGTTFLTSRAALQLCGMMPQYAALAALPPIVWLVARPALGWGATLALAALVVVQALADAVYAALPVAVVLVLIAGVRLVRPRSRAVGVRMLAALGMAGAVLSPMYAGYLAVRAANPELRTQSVWTAKLFGVETRHPWTGLPGGISPLALDPSVFLPILAGCALWIAGIVEVPPARRRAWRHAAVWLLVGWLLFWELPVRFPGLREFLLTGVVRDLARLAFPALIAVCLLVGLGVAACVDAVRARASRRSAAAAAAAVLAIVVWLRIDAVPWRVGAYPIARAVEPGAEAAVLRAGAGPVLVLPIGHPRVGIHAHATAMYTATAHWRTLLNGYSSYYPRGFPERMELVRRLPNPQALEALRRDTGLTNIVVRAAGLPALTTRYWRHVIATGVLPGVRIVHDDDDVLVLAIEPGP